MNKHFDLHSQKTNILFVKVIYRKRKGSDTLKFCLKYSLANLFIEEKQVSGILFNQHNFYFAVLLQFLFWKHYYKRKEIRIRLISLAKIWSFMYTTCHKLFYVNLFSKYFYCPLQIFVKLETILVHLSPLSIQRLFF